MKQIEFLATIENWIKRSWNKFVGRLRRNRSEARILARLDELETRILAELETRVDSGPAEAIPVFTPEVSIPLNSISVPIGDGQRVVEFQGIELSRRFYAEDLKRITETLYSTSPGQYLVHVRTLHRGKGLQTEYVLRETGEDGLEEDGQYAALGRLRSPLTVQEALRA